MDVVIDAQALTIQRRGGISRYFVELLKANQRFAKAEINLLTPYRIVLNDYAVSELPEFFRRPATSYAERPRVILPLRALQLRLSRRRSLIHHTYYDPRFLAAGSGRRRVCTVYDMIPERFPELFPKGNPHLAKRSFVTECDAVLAISECTRRDLTEIYNVDPQKVQVVPLGVGGMFRPRTLDGPEAERPYILFVGNRGGYKNFSVILGALEILPAAFNDLRLIAIGGGALSAKEKNDLSDRGLTRRVTQISGSDEKLLDLYQRAACMIYPSRYEGFGLPVVEAMASGCPTIVASAGSLPEVGGGAALYFDPASPEELADRITGLMDDETEKKRIVDLGIYRAGMFTWDRTVEQTAAFYKTLE